MKVGKGMTERDAATKLPKNWSEQVKAEGVFGASTNGWLKACYSLMANTADEPPFVEDSEEAFAEILANCILAARSEIANGDADIAAAEAFRAGIQAERARMKFTWEPIVSHGQQFSSGKKGKKKKTEERLELVRLCRDQLGLDSQTTRWRQKLTHAINDHPSAEKLFDDWEKIYRFLERERVFDGSREP
jgi:hypothetical protein